MKYLIVVPDGSADRPGAAGEGKTPLDVANMPNINGLAARGEIGLVTTIPAGISPGSDAANLAVMGYDPETDLTGRSPLEAVSMGIDMADTDVAFRTNLVTLRGDADAAYADLTIVDHSAGDITGEESEVLIRFLDAQLGFGKPENGGRVRFYPGVSYRHALIVTDGPVTESGVGDVCGQMKDYRLTPPHDILERSIGTYLPAGEGSGFIRRLMEDSYPLLRDHPINVERRRRGLNSADSIWVWGQGRRPKLSSFASKFGVEGSVISAVDLIKGIGISAGLESVSVEGATGTLKTNFAGKAEKAIAEFARGKDFVYLHVEAPDECSHQGNLAEKIEAIERIDGEVVGPILHWLKDCGEDYRVLVVPDHRTPLSIRTHSDEPVPYVFYDSRRGEGMDEMERQSGTSDRRFSETAAEAGRYFPSGKELALCFFRK
jgi:2,3-bisphosphoglycerate-independent phosphoglycerate mutase